MLPRYIATTLLLSVLHFSSFAQMTILVDLKQTSITAMPTGADGFVLFDSLIYERGEGEYFLKYVQYDTAFTSKWEQFVYFREGDKITANYNSGQHIYLAFETTEGGQLRLSRMDARYGAVDTSSFILPEKFQLQQLLGEQQQVWLVGRLKGAPAILELDLFKKTIQVLPLNVNNSNAEVVTAQIINGKFQFVVNDKIRNLNRLVVYRSIDGEFEPEPIDILTKTELSNVQLEDDQYLFGQFGKDKAKPDGIFMINIKDKGFKQFSLRDFWGANQARVLGSKDGQRSIQRINNTFLFENVRVEEDSLILWLEVFQQKFRSKTQTEKEIEREFRNFENFMSPKSFFGGAGGFTGSGTQIIEQRYREAKINNAIATGFDYLCHLRLTISKSGEIGQSEKYIVQDSDHLSTLNNNNIIDTNDQVKLLGITNNTIKSVSLDNKSTDIYPTTGNLDRIGRTRLTQWYDNTYMLRTYYRKDKEDYFTIQPIKLK